MEHRSEKAACLILLLSALSLPAADLSYRVRHERFWKGRAGTLTIGDSGLVWQQTGKDSPAAPVRWEYQDIQQLLLSSDRVVVLTYEDRKWRLGIDREFEFSLLPGQDVRPAYELLARRLDQRFVAALADEEAKFLWEVPAKLLGTIQGAQGVLRAGADGLVFQTERKGASRTWRYQDIENVSTSGPFQITFTTYERAKSHYGNLKGFDFQLKEPLNEKRFELLWRRLNRDKGLEFLTSIQENQTEP